MSDFPAFLAISLVVIATPGPDTAITVRNTLLGGRAGGVLTALGIASGQTIWAVATSAGIVALLTAAEPVFLAVKYAGAAYLVYLGIATLRSAFGSPAGAADGMPASRAARPLLHAAFRQGLISDLGNPKMAIFFASLLPQFVSGPATFSAVLTLGVAFAAMTFVWLALYAALVAKAGRYLRRPAIRRAIEGVTGTLLVGLGLRIAAEHR